MRRALCLVLLLAGCESFEPVGAYSGDATLGAQMRTILTRPDAEGQLDMNWTSASQARSGVQIIVRRTGERRLEVVLDDGCVVPFEQDPEPNERNASVSILDNASCEISVEGYSGPVGILGSAAFGRDQPTIQLQINGSVPPAADPLAPGSSSGNWHYSFDGSRPE